MSNMGETLTQEEKSKVEVDVYICENCGGNMVFD